MELVGDKMEKQFAVVEIIWEDACSSDVMTTPEKEDLHLLLTKSVGYLIRKNKTSITIATALHPDNHGTFTIKGTLIIPMDIVRKINYLKERKDK